MALVAALCFVGSSCSGKTQANGGAEERADWCKNKEVSVNKLVGMCSTNTFRADKDYPHVADVLACVST